MSKEGSNDQYEEIAEHTINDTAKQISNAISILKGFTMVNMDASYETLRQVRSLACRLLKGWSL